VLTKSDIQIGQIFGPKHGKLVIPPANIQDRRKTSRFSQKLIQIESNPYYNKVSVSFSCDSSHWMYKCDVSTHWIIENYDFYVPEPKPKRNRLTEIE